MPREPTLNCARPMKTKFGIRFVGVCGTCAALALVQNVRGADSATPPAKGNNPPTAPASDALTRVEAQKLVGEARQYVAHPSKSSKSAISEPKVTTPEFDMAEPPPAPRPEMKSETPSPGMVWVPGHYMPVKGQWRWVMGEWAVPALPISVWIPAAYNEKEKKWSPGYWQPDIPAAGSADAVPAMTKDGKAIAPSTNSGY